MKKYFVLTLLLISTLAFGQEQKSSWFKNNVTIGGYIKYLNTINFHDTDDLLSDNLWHNRINLKVFLSDKWQVNFGLRNRILYGDMLKIIPDYGKRLQNDEGMLQLSKLFLNTKQVIVLSESDRLNVNFTSKKWQIILGRQRINWGKNVVWNPNDWFNTSNYLDFDYEEKPGIDALRVSYDTGNMSNLEMTYTSDKNFAWDKNTFVAKYQFNYRQYDIQLLAGKYQKYAGAGLGWEGNINNFGFKGESSVFKSYNEQKKIFVVTSLGLDYAFKNGNNWLFSILYNGNYDQQVTLDNLFDFKLNVSRIFPSDWAFFNQFSGNFGPAWQWSFAVIYARQNSLFITIPTIAYNISDNWDFDIVAQSFFADLPGIEQRNIVNFRLRYSF